MNLFDLILGFSFGVSSIIVVFIFKCKCIYTENHSIRKDHRVKGKLDSKERSHKKYVSVKNDLKTMSVNINKIKTQIKSVERNDKKPFKEYKDIITRIEVLKREVLKNSADVVPKVQGPPPPPPPPSAPTAPIAQWPPPPPPPMMTASNSVCSDARPNATAQKTYCCIPIRIPITTELLKSVVLKPTVERKGFRTADVQKTLVVHSPCTSITGSARTITGISGT